MNKKSKLKRCLDFCMNLSNLITENHIFAYASQASFFVIISSVPFIMIVLNILRVVLPISQQYFDNIIQDFLPVQIQPLATSIISDYYSQINIPLVSVTSLFLVWTASRGVKAISYGLRIVFKSQETENYIIVTLYSLAYTVVFLVSIVASVGALLFGKHIANLISNYFPPIKSIMNIVLNLRYLFFLVFLTLVFMSAYKFLGKTKIKFRQQFWGALLSAVFWLVFSYGYSLYIANISRLSYVYGSLAAIIFLMLWLWFCMISLLFGAQVNCWLYERNISVVDYIKNKVKQQKNQKKI